MRHRIFCKSSLIVGLSLLTSVCFGQSLMKSDTNKSGDRIYSETSSEVLIDDAEGQFSLELALQRRYFLNQANVIIKIQTNAENPAVVDSSSPCQIELVQEDGYELKNRLDKMSVTRQDAETTVITGMLLLSNYEVEVLRKECLKSVRLTFGNLVFEQSLVAQHRDLLIRLFELLDGTE